MQLYSKFNLIKDTIKGFNKDENGAIAVVFAILLLPVMALTGATIDYSQASNIKVKMQKAVDAAALGAGRASKKNDNEAYLEGVAQDVFDSSMAQYGFDGQMDLDGGFTDEGNYRVEVDTRMDTNFLKMVGKSSLPVSVEAEVFLGSGGNLEVAMVYHISRSINLRKLKEGSRELIDELMSDDNDGNVKFSLVPFYKYVNIGVNSVDDDGNNDGSNVGSSWLTMTGFSNSPASSADWKGCVGTRKKTHAIRDDQYSGSNKARAIVEHSAYCSTKRLIPLTGRKNVITNGVNAMVSHGKSWADYSHLGVGLVWGWATLSQSAPFTHAAPYSDDNNKVLIFVNDRVQNRSMASDSHAGSWGTSVSDANAEVSNLCSNMRRKGIIIYTINFGQANSGVKRFMRGCAGNGGEYFYATNGHSIEDAFEEIADDLKDLAGGGGGGDLRLVK